MNLNQLKIGPRLALGYGTVVALMLVIIAITVLRLEHLNADNQQLQEYQRRAALADEWRSLVNLNASRALAMAKSGGAKEVNDFFGPAMAGTSERISALQKELGGLIDSDAGKALLTTIAGKRQIYVDARKEVLAKLAANDAAAQALVDSSMLPASVTYVGAIDALAKYQQERVGAGTLQISADARNTQILIVMLGLLGAGAAVLFAALITRSVLGPVRQGMAIAERIAVGDLSHPIPAEGRDEMGDLMRSLARMQGALANLVDNVRSSTDSIGTASSQIASGNQDLSSRTEQTASNLQETASAMEQLTGTVNQSADSARTANQLASSASEVAQRGGAVVAQVVATMDQINTASKKIADIIGTIDGIAFQTNILALNAAVEAARAGEQGRGFAVVAGEVRSLAQRSAEAAREIKSLIGASVEQVESGSRLVKDAGSTMTEIVSSVQRVSDMIAEISAAAGEQSQGIGQVNTAVAQLDQMTQQNAALVEESASAAQSLADQAQRLSGAVAAFRTVASA